MAYDDMRVVMYKILRYLYDCNKSGVEPTFENMCHHCKLFRIHRDYWTQIMLELMDAGYIKGFTKIATKDGTLIQMGSKPRITLAGVDYLEENSVMKQIKEFLGESFEILLSAVISAAI